MQLLIAPFDYSFMFCTINFEVEMILLRVMNEGREPGRA